ncbi:MAG: helix-turn-helix domain-containing protein [Clostridia bacterium]|nr:helix-turn-helix domain-containing protein [Clostridia bacterium]
MDAKFYEKETYVNEKVGYTLRMNYSTTENFELHYHDYYEIFIAVSGKTVQVVNGKKQILPEGSMVFIRPGDVHTYRKEGEFSFANLTFTADTVEKLSAYFGPPLHRLLAQKMPPTVMLALGDFAKTMKKLNTLNTVGLGDKEMMTLRMKLVLSQLLAIFLEFDKAANRETLPVWLAALADRIKNPDYMSMTLSDMAAFSGKTKEHISRSFGKHFGMTVSAFVNEQRLNYSANLLLNTNLPVLDICYTAGFQSVSWFYRTFQRKYGQSPAAFRKTADPAVPL